MLHWIDARYITVFFVVIGVSGLIVLIWYYTTDHKSTSKAVETTTDSAINSYHDSAPVHIQHSYVPFAPGARGGVSTAPYARAVNAPPHPTPFVGFWYGSEPSCTKGSAPSTGATVLSFPGRLLSTVPPLQYPSVPRSWAGTSILTTGGGDAEWDDDTYTSQAALLPYIKKSGYDGVCYDWEMVGAKHSTDGFNQLMYRTKKAGLTSIVTTTGEGPYRWNAASKDATGILWENIDYFVPQLYDSKGKMYANWHTYADFWKRAGFSSINDVTFSPPPAEKILWGVTPSHGPSVVASNGGAGYVEWCYDPDA